MFGRSAPIERPAPIGEPPAPPPADGGEGSSRQQSPAKPVSRARVARVGFLWNADGVSDPVAPFMGTGAQVAAGSLAPALMRHGGFQAIDVFVRQSGIEASQKRLSHFSGTSPHDPPTIRFVPERQLPTLLRIPGYDVLHDTGTDLTRLSAIRSHLSRRVFPITCSQHGCSYSFQLFTQYIPTLMAQIYPCDAVVCLTEASRRAMELRLMDVAEGLARASNRPLARLPRLELIPWGIDTEHFAARDQAAARRDLELPQGRPIFLCLGRVRIEDKMDLAPLLFAFQRVCQTLREPPLLILAGTNPGEYGDEIMGYAAQLGLGGKVRSFFNLPPASKPTLYAASDVLVAPTDSLSESFGLTIVEAMAAGRAVIASEWDGYKELIAHGDTGFLVRTDWADCLGELRELSPYLSWDQQHLHAGQSVNVDVSKLADYMTRLAENPQLRGEMGRRGQARARALYDWEVVAGQWGAMWSELCAVAATLAREETSQMDYLRHDSFKYFSHYASRIVGDAISVRITARGKEVLAGHGPLFLHPWARGFLEPAGLRAALAALKPARWVTNNLSVGELIAILGTAHGMGRDEILMHLMWLAKHDLISLRDEAR